MVDTVSPGVTEFEINKRDAVLISAKTTLRERWQEVPEEMGSTGAREMFLATLGEKVSDNVLNKQTAKYSDCDFMQSAFKKRIEKYNNILRGRKTE